MLTLGVVTLLAWAWPPAANWLARHPAIAPLPWLSLVGTLLAVALWCLSHRDLVRARQAAMLTGGLCVASLVLITRSGADSLVHNWWSVHGQTPPLAIVAAQSATMALLALATWLLCRPAPSDRTLLATTTLGILVAALITLRVLLAGTRIQAGAPPLGQFSLIGVVGASLGILVLFILVAERQPVPHVPPRWAPEIAGAVAAGMTLLFARLLEVRVQVVAGQSSAETLPLLRELPSLALVLGLCVSVLVMLVLRLLRNNWLLAQRVEHDRLTAALDTVTAGLWEYEVDTQRTRRSAAQLRQLGYDADTIGATRQGWLGLLHPDDVAHASAALAAWSQDSMESVEVTYRVRAADRSYRTIVDRGRVLERHDDGRPRLVLGVSVDVTDRLRDDAARDASERRYRGAFESALQGQVLLDADGRCVDANATALHVLGLHRDDVIGVPLAEAGWFTGLRGSQAALEEALRVARTGQSVSRELETHQLDGRVGVAECSFTPLMAADGTRQVLCELRDVTSRRRSEAALREIWTFSTLGRMAARVAHEINNPLAGIRNAFTLLADAVPDTHPHRRFLQSIEREIDRIAMVTRALYETYSTDPERVLESSLPHALSDAVRFIEEVNRSRGVRVVTDLRDAPAVVPVPDALLRQTLYNLVQNAVEASPNGGEVRIRALQQGTECVLTVSDDGPAIPLLLRERIFEPSGGQRTVALRMGPMGFGLAGVRHSLGALGGTVRLLDAVPAGGDTMAVGATFEVRLPMTRSW
jgi:PAS domain S-box-containing protein